MLSKCTTLYSRVGGGFPLPTITQAPELVTSFTVKKTVAGPGGKTLPFGGVVNVSDVPSDEMIASMNTRRALEWKAWLEKPWSIKATVIGLSGVQQHGLRDTRTL